MKQEPEGLIDVGPATPSVKVGLVIIATGRYDRFVPELVAGAREHVVGLDRVFVLSDRPVSLPDTCWLPWGHLPWPYPTLLRYRAITAYRDVLSRVDVLLYVDVDMRFVKRADFTGCTGLVAVRHPGFVDVAPENFPYERRSASRVAIAPGHGERYFAGGVQGGVASIYLKACEVMSSRVQVDVDASITPVWHDESVWNHFCLESPPATVLPETFCSPEHEHRPEAVIIALDKDHDELRQTSLGAKWQRRLTQGRRRARRAAFSIANRMRKR